MSNQTYGDFPGVDVTTPSKTVGVAGDVNVDNIQTEIPGIDIYGHKILIKDNGLECLECEMEESIPEVFLKSSGFYEVVYKLYIFGKFKHSRCEASFEQDNSILNHDKTNVGYDPNRVHWVGGDTYTTDNSSVQWQVPEGQRFMLEGKEYVYKGSGKFVDSTTGRAHDIAELQAKHGSKASHTLAASANTQQPYQRDSLSIGDHNMSIDSAQTQLDTATQPDVTVQGDNLTEQAEETLKEKAARALKDKRNALTR